MTPSSCREAERNSCLSPPLCRSGSRPGGVVTELCRSVESPLRQLPAGYCPPCSLLPCLFFKPYLKNLFSAA